MRSPELEHVAWLITERGDQRHIESPDLRVRIRTGRSLIGLFWLKCSSLAGFSLSMPTKSITSPY